MVLWRITVLSLLLGISQRPAYAPAYAYFDPPWVTPERPVIGQETSVHIHGGRCDWIVERPGFPQISREGSAIRLLEYGNHYEEGDELCTDHVGTLTRSLGGLATGTYSLAVDMAYEHPVFGMTILPIGTVAFTVSPLGEPAPVPTLDNPAQVLLLLLVVLLTFVSLRMRRLRRP
jgi:hypothetical protein